MASLCISDLHLVSPVQNKMLAATSLHYRVIVRTKLANTCEYALKSIKMKSNMICSLKTNILCFLEVEKFKILITHQKEIKCLKWAKISALAIYFLKLVSLLKIETEILLQNGIKIKKIVISCPFSLTFILFSFTIIGISLEVLFPSTLSTWGPWIRKSEWTAHTRKEYLLHYLLIGHQE